ncbi:MAG: DUF3775 domain-containing protein [Pseudomonadota bacterium]|nr:DUF3775 domain-containing protein [Pseudomonadota bacterium]
MLDVRLETICFIIAKAREFQAKEQVVIPETPSSPSDDWALQVLADHIDDMSLQEIKASVDDLSPEQQAALVALMWLGRGDYSLDEWEAAMADARDQYEEKQNTTEYLLAHPMVSDHLEEGLIAHGYSCED